MKLTRRELSGALAGAAVARPQADTPEQLLQKAVAEQRRDSAAVAKLQVPIEAEPAFAFHPQ